MILDFAYCSWAVSQERFFLVCWLRRPLRVASILDPRQNAKLFHARGLSYELNSNFFGALQQKLLQCSNYRNKLKILLFLSYTAAASLPQTRVTA
jgi:hypothetical protein